MERTATFTWFGPFELAGKPGTAPERRLAAISNFHVARKGIYVVVGSRRRSLMRQDRILYIGRTWRSFAEALGEQLTDKRDDVGRLRVIEREGAISAIWLVVLTSAPTATTLLDVERDATGRELAVPMPQEVIDYENLLVHLALPYEGHMPKDLRSHLNWQEAAFQCPQTNVTVVNRFDMESWRRNVHVRWRPSMIPDVIDCHCGGDGRSSRTQLIWTGTRAIRMQRRECGPGGLLRAQPSRPHSGPDPSL